MEWDQDGLVPFSLSANGLAMEDLEENVCLCMPLTADRLDKPEWQKDTHQRPVKETSFLSEMSESECV